MEPIKKIFIFLVLQGMSLALIFTSYAQMQEVKNLKNLTIELMPEFDSEGILVIYKGTLAPDTPLPAAVTLHLPSRININAVAYRDKTTMKLLLAKHVTESKDDKTLLTLTAAADNFWIEFYTPADYIFRDGDIRDFSFSWNEALSVEELVWHIQKPINADDFNVTPDGGEMIQGDYGIPTYQVVQNNLPAMEVSNIRVTYKKPDNTFTYSVINERLAGTSPVTPGAQTSKVGKRNSLPVVIFILVLVIIVICVVFFLPGKGKKS